MPPESESPDSASQMRRLVDRLPEMAWTALPDGQLDFVNQTMQDQTGVAASELLGWGWNQLLPPEEGETLIGAWKQALLPGKPVTLEQRLRVASGDFCWHLTSATPLKSCEGCVEGWIGTHTNIHAQKETEATLRAEHQHKDDFLAFFAHELRNPLAPLTNAIQVLELTKQNPAQVGELIPMIRRQVETLKKLIDESLDVARMMQGRITLRQERISANSVAKAALATVQTSIAERRLQLSVTLPDPDAWLNADIARLTQALTILLSSAVQATEPQGQIGLVVERVNQEVEIRVRDSSAGLDPAQLSHIFELFPPADQKPVRGLGALGSGLWFARRLVELHGGTMEARSDGPGCGCEFVVRLPCAEAPDRQPPAESTATPEKPPQLKILVVDDVRASARTLALMLSTLGQVVSTAFDGPSAIASLHEGAFDLVFLDVSMPGMDGREVARRLRAEARFRTLYIVALTGCDQDSALQESRDAGFDEHLTKPASLDQLTGALRRAAARLMA